MKLSIIIPVYNTSAYIEKCIDSILNQSFNDFELIIVDDCSTDNSFELCKNYSKKDHRVKVFKLEQNSGPSKARNYGLDRAHGDYISFIDSDDYIDKNFYSNVFKIFDNNQNIDMVITTFKQVNEKGEIKTIYQPDNSYVTNSAEEALQKAYGGKDDLDFIFNLCWNKVFRAKLFFNVRFPEGRLQEDAFVIPFLIYSQDRFMSAIAWDSVYYYFDNVSSISYEYQKSYKDMLRRMDLLYLYEQHMKLYLKKNNNTLFYRSQMNYVNNLLTIFQLYYHSLRKDHASEFKRLHKIFRNYYFSLLNNTYCSKKLFLTLLLFYISPKLYFLIFKV